ncbi:Gfo/Idh/MocA family oxidoreductase [Ruficoccus amylovorans]|uniref:Gfo/Idh/MocA family oxidoreductase n=1 Tax=Ruficoccus amylovorans TaxID=1804625 RepID=A0A842HI02_9BACT|nr:Gfo/Idh/MocA family oxidoreductase [Ruficoccus amylovorans]MBC2595194.1 Gfo/Idh/MocA family oxidoreductase [Ruficoccus amylovorans]
MSDSSSSRKRYAIVGLGGRSSLFSEALLGTYSGTSELVALCDRTQTRMDYHNGIYGKKHKIDPVPTYLASDFDRMIAEQKPDVVIVTTMDRTHHDYIIRAMKSGCDVITEKPMTVDAGKCRAILDVVERTGKNLTVTFNYRYSPSRTKVKELIMSGVIGDVQSVHFEWLLDTRHGADYFRRWHRNKINSGGLMVHKSTHHFDLVNWWLDSTPEIVFGFGKLGFYGRANAEKRGVTNFYYRSTGCPAAKDDPFALDLKADDHLKGLYYDAESEDGYLRDQSVFGDGINIEDTMNVLVRYVNGAQMSYALTAFSPWEGFRIAFNGTKGRIELEEVEKSYVNTGKGAEGEGESQTRKILVRPLWEKPYEVDPGECQGSHGGGDVVMLRDIFGQDKEEDPFSRAAFHIDGAKSILTGIAANQSFETGLPVRVGELIKLNRD